jgi:hypothetical protein
MTIILNKKYINNFNINFDFEDFNQDYIICNNNKNIYDIVNKYCLKKSNSSSVLNNLIDFENKYKPNFNFDTIDKIKYNKYEFQKLILRWMSYIQNNSERYLSFYPENIKFDGGCILNNNYNKIWSILSYLLKDKDKKNLIICDDYDVNNLINFFNLNKVDTCVINDNSNKLSCFNIVNYSFLKQKNINFLYNYSWHSIFISNIHNLENFNINFTSRYKWCSSTPFKILNNKTFLKIINFLSNKCLNQINYNILIYVIQVLFIYTEDNTYYNKNKIFNISKKEITFEMNYFEKKFYKNLINNNINFDIIKKFTSFPFNNTIYNSFNFDPKTKIQNNNQCIICYNKNNNTKLECGHEFCYNCIIKQLLIKPNCPLCRKEINSNQINIKKNNLSCSKHKFLKYFIENNKRKKILIVTQFKETESFIKKFLIDKKSNFTTINKSFKKQSNFHIFLLKQSNLDYLKEFKNMNYILFFEPLYYSKYLSYKIESEIIGKINLDQKTNLKIITIGFKNTIDEKFLI